MHKRKITNQLTCFLPISILLCTLHPVLEAGLVKKESLVKVQEIKKSQIKKHLQYLASSQLKGRNTGSSGAALAAKYIAANFKKNGLAPIPGSSGYFQRFGITRSRSNSNSKLRYNSENGSSYTFRKKDFLAAPWGGESIHLEGESVFLGYGISAPKLGYDAYQNVNIKNKIVIILGGAPKLNKNISFREVGKFDYGDFINKSILASKRGAIAIVLILRPHERLSSYQTKNLTQGRAYLSTSLLQVNVPVFLITFNAAKSFFAEILVNDEQNNPLLSIIENINSGFHPYNFELDGKFIIRAQYQRLRIHANNVLGLVHGSDAILKNTFVIIGGHFDHIGVGTNNEIFFGADDNASGIAALLELTRAIQINSPKPRRSIIFAAWSGEEIGLLGSQYYIENPVVPLNDTIAVLQMDMIGRNAHHASDNENQLAPQKESDNHNSLNIMGTILTPKFKSIIKENNVNIHLDLRFISELSSINLFRRSDQWSFLKKSIPVLFFFTGFHPDYHKTSDTPDKINFEKMEKISKLIYLTIWNIADKKSQLIINNDILSKITFEETPTHK